MFLEEVTEAVFQVQNDVRATCLLAPIVKGITVTQPSTEDGIVKPGITRMQLGGVC